MGGERKDIRSDEETDEETPSCVHWRHLEESDEENAVSESSEKRHAKGENGEAVSSTRPAAAPEKGPRRRRGSPPSKN